MYAGVKLLFLAETLSLIKVILPYILSMGGDTTEPIGLNDVI